MEKIYPVVLSSSNITDTSTNASLQYNLPGSSSKFKNAQVSIGQVNVFNSIFNINKQLYNNNSFSIIFPTGSTTYTLNIDIVNSYMSNSDLNSYVQQKMIDAGAYLINGSTNVYFWQIQSNPTLYSTQINEFPVPTSLGTYTRPSTGLYSLTGTGLPTTSYTPQTVITSNNFGKLIGLLPNTYPSVQQSSTYSVSSIFTPIIQPCTSLNIHCSLVNSKFSVPSDIIGNVNLNTVPFGGLITYQPTNYQWLSIADQTVNSINLYLTDQDNNKVVLQDPTVSIILLIKEIN